MASEIEIVGEGGTPRGEGGEVSSSARSGEDGQKRDDVYTAAAYGDVDKLRKLVEDRGCSVLEPDSGGYFALQWCALNNRTAAAQYLLEVVDPSLCLSISVLVSLGTLRFLLYIHLRKFACSSLSSSYHLLLSFLLVSTLRRCSFKAGSDIATVKAVV